MTVLRSGISAHTTVLPVDAPLPNPSYPIFYDIDSETVKVTDGADTTEWQVERGVASTQQAKHAKNVRLVANASPYGGGGGGVTVDPVTGPSFPADTLVARGAVESPSGTATLTGSVVFSDTDPGTIGARNFWLHTDPNNNATYLELLCRNDADTGWRHVGWADNYEGSLGVLLGQVYDDDGNVTGAFSMNAGTFSIVGSGDPVGANWWQGSVEVTSSGLGLAFLDHTGASFEVKLTAGGIVINGLPTSDPGVGHKVWSDAGTLKITAAS